MATESGWTPQRLQVGPVNVDAVQLDQVVDRILGVDRPRSVHPCNAYTFSLASKYPLLVECLAASGPNLADGFPIARLARRQGLPHMKQRVSGADFMRACIDRGRAVGLRHYLYGSTPEVQASMVRQIETRWRGAKIVGLESPPFRDLTDAARRESAREFEAVAADVVWVGLGTPKQDFEVERLVGVSGATFVAIGAAFDLIAGTKKQPRRWVQRSGLEWLFRLCAEPKRLWSRYLPGIPAFGGIVLRQRALRCRLQLSRSCAVGR